MNADDSVYWSSVLSIAVSRVFDGLIQFINFDQNSCFGISPVCGLV